MKNSKRFVRHLVLLFAPLASGCATPPHTTTEQVGQRRVESMLARHHTTPVVFENGLGATLDLWRKVFPEIARTTTAFAYNRPGYGNSEAAATPRDGPHIVDELRALLRSKGLNPPYVLVGHSLGGLYMQYFARRYPDEVAALVLVDSTHPAQLKGRGAYANWPIWYRLMFGLASTVTKEEFNAVDATGDSVLALPTITGKPVIVLSASRPQTAKSELVDDANEKSRDVVRLYPGARQIWVDCGHRIPLERPDAVIAAIREALASTRSGNAAVR